MDKSQKARAGTLKKYISDQSLRLTAADRAFFADMAKVRIIDEVDAGFHYKGRSTKPALRLERLVQAGVLVRIDVFQPGRGNFKAYQFANKDIARVMGGKLPVIGAKRNALHEVITSKIYFAEGRPSTFTLEDEMTKELREQFKGIASDGSSSLPDAVFYRGESLVICESDSGQYNKAQIESKQASWKGISQVWGQPSRSAARVENAKVHRF